MIEKNGLKVYSQEEVLNEFIGPPESPARQEFEYELQMEVLGHLIKTARKEKGLTQEELGKRIGVQKAQISKLEKSVRNVTIDTLVKVFDALGTRLKIRLEPTNVLVA